MSTISSRHLLQQLFYFFSKFFFFLVKLLVLSYLTLQLAAVRVLQRFFIMFDVDPSFVFFNFVMDLFEEVVRCFLPTIWAFNYVQFFKCFYQKQIQVQPGGCHRCEDTTHFCQDGRRVERIQPRNAVICLHGTILMK